MFPYSPITQSKFSGEECMYVLHPFSLWKDRTHREQMQMGRAMSDYSADRTDLGCQDLGLWYLRNGIFEDTRHLGRATSKQVVSKALTVFRCLGEATRDSTESFGDC